MTLKVILLPIATAAGACNILSIQGLWREGQRWSGEPTCRLRLVIGNWYHERCYITALS